MEQDDLRSTNSHLATLADGMVEEYHLDPARANIVRGLDIPADARVLEIGAGLGAVTRYLGERAAVVDAIEPSFARARVARARTRDLPGVEILVGEHSDVPDEPVYDVIVVVGVLEYTGAGTSSPEPYVDFLAKLGRCLRPGGTLAVAIENKIGVKYLVGAPEDHTDVLFDSIEDYPAGSRARTFARRELEQLFVAAGLIPEVRIAFPDYKITRAVMDADALTGEAPELLCSLPTFPSRDMYTQRPPLADEGRVWRTLVQAGLGAETGNSFLVLAGKGGPQTLWPDDLAAVYYSQGRREAYSFEKKVLRDEDGLKIVRARIGDADESMVFQFTEATERLIPGSTVQDAAVGATGVETVALLQAWRTALTTRFGGLSVLPVDLIPGNFIVRADGSLESFDQEWNAQGWELERVVRRGVFWFAAKLVRATPRSRWASCTTVRDVMVSLGLAADLDPAGEWIDSAVAEEAEFLAEVRQLGDGESITDAADRIAADLRSLVADQLESLAFGERLTDILDKVRGYLAVSEESVAYLLTEKERLSAEKDHLSEFAAREESAKDAAVASTVQTAEKLRSSEALKAHFHAQLVATDRLAQSERARAEAAASELAGVRGSRVYRAVQLYFRAVEKAAPAGTLRRRLYSKSGNAAGLGLRKLRPTPMPVVAPIVIPLDAAPRVSIIVPVHGKWDYTERCLRAIAATAGDIAFEVIVVDDASPDETAERLSAIQGVHVVTMPENVGFVGACNAGIAEARGEFVVLLNNDTRVNPLWLIPLVETLEEPGVGLVGSRLVYPDGRLQEAGGIVFSDGSGWNYGKFCDPEDPAFTYRRDVDYCSGASIIIRKSTLDAVGNLDTRFAPAYYDDTDLAFSVRELGLRVVYEPRSLVVHDEGISNGTDETSGIKAYQAINKEKFVDKWRHRLVDHCAPDAANVPFAVRRRNGERIVVVIDHYVPRPDEDSGSVRMMGILRTLRQLGYSVIFVPDNKFRTEPWTGILGRMGVEVFYGHGDFPGLLRDLAEHIETVMVSRVTVAWNYAFMLRTVLPDVPMVFDTVDLHYLREERAAELAGQDTLSPRALTLKSLELAIAESADTTVVVSTFEQELLGQVQPGSVVKVLPNVHVREVFSPTVDGRAGLLFVGSFAHHPNADGLRWLFSEILPLVEKRVPGVPVKIVGRSPDADLVASAPTNVEFLGWVEDLTPLYDSARVALAPLRYGAGVKGKIGEAMVHGVPVVMTPVGAEGMQISHLRDAWVAQDAPTFAAGIVELLTDDEMWSSLSKIGAEHINDIFGPEKFAEMLRDIVSRG
ncbi:Glycosyltransferase, GT2 family [Sanguibacter gelidistatuariae]|uniref:Glycosyltransferase, GT2 family n=2 Tax=Sanguibacter gelidistatuariae TaxID=1814289 RepID=A0A1G6XZM9_9MICO|nr:Glycosyltransferase, GT2 family [Sanguibacter gelidistatuariae]